MSDKQHPINTSSQGGHIETHIGDDTSNVNVGKDISSVNIGNVESGGHESNIARRDAHVHGDQVHGDKVVGDKVIGNKIIIQRLDASDARNQRNHQMLRQMVRKFWIDGVLKSSLYNEVLIRLNMEERSNVVDNLPWDLILQQPGQPDSELPHGISIVNVFDQMNHLLLILGEPGCGKTTMLLELADALLVRAEDDPANLTPVVFNLSSWAEKRLPLAEWLVGELHNKYNIPRTLGQKWVRDGEILPLLDGLDEVRQTDRNACVEAINTFRQAQEHLLPLIVCSRIAEYEALTTQLKLQGAVLVQPLTIVQIDEYLTSVGGDLSAIRETLKQNTEFQELTTLPLMLSIMALAYQGMSRVELSAIGSIQSHRQHLFNTYVKRMFVHRGTPHIYPVQKIICWLQWLAATMSQSQETVFLIERLQPYRLKRRSQILVYRLIFGMGKGLMVGLLFMPFISLAGSLIVRPTAALIFGLFTGIAIALFFGLYLFGLDLLDRIVKKFVFKESLEQTISIEPIERLKLQIGKFVEVVFSGLFVALVFGWLAGHSIGSGFRLDVTLVVFLGFIGGGLVQGTRNIEIAQTTYPNQGIWNSFYHMRTYGLFGGIAVSLVCGLIFGLFENVFREVFNIILVSEFGDFLFAIISINQLGNFVVDLRFEKLAIGVAGGLASGLAFALIGGYIKGGKACIQHLALRYAIYLYNFAPLNYTRFLDHCHDRIFLRKVGGGYIFIHRMLMEHFASLTDEDIERIVRSVEEKKA